MFFTFADEHQIKNKNKLLLVLALKSGSGSISALLLLPVNLWPAEAARFVQRVVLVAVHRIHLHSIVLVGQ